MNIIAVDDEHLALKSVERAIGEVVPDCTLSCFTLPSKAVQYARENRVDIAFLDIDMGSISGVALAEKLKNIYDKTNIVFVTGYSEYALDAFSVTASDYLLKPVSGSAVAKAMERLRKPVDTKSDKKLRIQTFGNFEAFVDGKPIDFARSKTKEMLAYLVDRRGALCNNSEIIAVIWEDKRDSYVLQGHFRHLVSDLIQTLKSEGIEDILLKRRGQLAVVPDKFTCDLYDLFTGVTGAANSYAGEYMSQYSWAEFTNGHLKSIITAD